jgi:SET domain-containing protein
MQKINAAVSLELRDTPRGWGVFSLQPIPANSTIETAPGIIVPQQFLNTCYFVATADGLKPSEIVLDQYGLGWTDGNVFFPLGWIGLYNHSDEPNAIFAVHSEKTLSVISLKAIAADEEIFVYYGEDWWAKKPFLQKL